MLNENVVKLLKSGMWDLATCDGGEPNVVPVAFKDVTADGKLVVGDVFLDTTLKNLAANNGRIAISVYDAQNLEGYQVKGTAQYVTEGRSVQHLQGHGGEDVQRCCYRERCAYNHAGESHRHYSRRGQ